MYLLIIFLPLVGAIGAGFFGKFIGERGAVLLTSSLLVTGALLSINAFYEVGICGSVTHIEIAPWIESEAFVVNWGFLFDSLTVIMLVVVTSISSLVHIYSSEYIKGDPHQPRFISYLSLFTFFILILVTADNYLQMFVGWEGVGLCSYLLINFWYTRIQANKAAIQAIIVNRIGDFGLALGIIAIFYQFKTVDYNTVFASIPKVTNNITFLNINFDSLTLISILLFVGAIGKSAQLGLHCWLPNAIEGPTPVSALIHAATMVTAGVFLVARSSPILEYSSTALSLVVVFGACTAFFAASTGLLQNDLKKVIAYSTCSQLGYMIFACGLSAYNVGIFHLANHAFFKALLFLSAGSVIHAMGDEQDIRKMGGLVNILPFTYAMFFIGSIALIGFPFLTGFYSKDVILEVAYASYSIPGHFAHWLGTIAAFFTAFYSIRLLHLTFLSQPAGHRKLFENAHDAPSQMGIPLFILSLGSIFIGYLSRDIIIGLGTDFWSNALFTHPNNLTIIEAEFIPHYIKLIPVIFSLTGAGSAFLLYTYAFTFLYSIKTKSGLGRRLYTFLNRKWFFDKVFTEFLVMPSLHHGYHTTYKIIDRGIIELLGPHGLSNLLYRNAWLIGKFQSGYIYHYTLIMLLGLSLPIFGFLLYNKGLNPNEASTIILFFIITLLFLNQKKIHLNSFLK